MKGAAGAAGKRPALIGGLTGLARLVERGGRIALGLLLLAMVLLNVANALSRYLLGRAIQGSDELLVFGMVWVVFLGAAFVTADRRHLSFDVAVRRLPPGARAAVRFGGDLVTLGLLVFVAVQSYDAVARLAALGQKSMAAEIPTAVPHAAILVGFGLTALIVVVSLGRAAVAALLKDRPVRKGRA